MSHKGTSVTAGGSPRGAVESSSHRTLSTVNAWALSFGCIIGWGAFMMPGSTMLPMAGPVGTIVALTLGGLAMVVIAWNIQYMTNRYPDSGGAFSFTKHMFGYDHAFLCTWALVLAFIAIIWANATSIVLMSRFLLGSTFQVGFHYTVAGYDVYFGEILITLFTLVLFAFLSLGRKKIVTSIHTGFAITLFLGVVLCFVIVYIHEGGVGTSLDPPFLPTENEFSQVMNIFTLSPWAFVGYESVSHAADEFNFSRKRLFLIVVSAIACGTIVYSLITCISVMGTPSEYPNWFAYISDLGNLDGLKALPVFNAMQESAGNPGLLLLAFVIISALFTSLLGLFRSTSRLLLAASRDGIFRAWFAKTNKEDVPTNIILFVLLISVPVPFVGRAAIGWIVDVTSICASIAYFYISACALKAASQDNNLLGKAMGIMGMVVSFVFFSLPLIPQLLSINALATESYLIFAAWSILGLLFFRYIFGRDKEGRFGTSTIVWMAMLFMIFYTSTMWVRQATHVSTSEIVDQISDFYTQEYVVNNVDIPAATQRIEREFLLEESAHLQSSLLNNSLVQMVLIGISLIIMFNIYALMRKREREHDLIRMEAEKNSAAKTVFLSNMSHDIRTPLNAIIGYTNIAQREDTTEDEMREYLQKIDASSKHLLALINDVLEMSRIESGKMDLDPVACNMVEAIDEAYDMFATQMAEKHLDFVVDTAQVRDRYVICDKNRLNRVLLNLLSNAYKFTPEGGSVSVRLLQMDGAQRGMARFELRVKDTGIGMTPEFAERVFDAFERERNATVSGIQGTGLGMAITKSIVDLMGGTIDIDTAPGKGTEFIVDVTFDLLNAGEVAKIEKQEIEVATHAIDFSTKRVLIAEDNQINLEIAEFLMEDIGFAVDTATNGKEALDKIVSSPAGTYDVLLTDIQMPQMDGYELAHRVRRLSDPKIAEIPIVACSANAFQEDVQASLDAGMNAHLSKPIDLDVATRVLSQVLSS
ncbi:MAG: amino acid permease [Coriobacteriales bacterium]|nr:amino acid permease [Coriobacteriales bacterium]